MNLIYEATITNVSYTHLGIDIMNLIYEATI
ncbi:hypothetical protein A5806_002502, partial [Enterococcus faecium]